MQRLSVCLSVFVLAAAVFAALLDSEGASAGSTRASDAPCAVGDADALAAVSERTIGGHLAYQDWLADGKEGVGLLGAALEKEFGGYPGGAVGLKAGLIGEIADHHAQQMAVVVDAVLVDTDALQRRLDSALAGSGLEARVIVACHSTSELLAVGTALEQRDWHPAASEAKASYYLDAGSSTWVYAPSEGYEEAAAALAASYGDLVTIEDGAGEAAQLSRQVDAEPHKGGAGIRRQTWPYDNECTSAFTAVMPNGTKGSVSVGHCLDNGDNVRSGDAGLPNEYYGEAAGKHMAATFDMIRIQPQGEEFHRKIWTNHNTPIISDAVGAENPNVGDLVCLSGATTYAICGVEVMGLNGTIGTVPNLIRLRRNGDYIARDGDSGGPVFQYHGYDTVSIRGMLMGAHECEPTNPENPNAVLRCKAAFAHTVQQIRSHLGVSDIGG